MSTVPLPEDVRKKTLQLEIGKALKHGWVVQSYSDFQVILTKPKRIGWFWNTIFTLLTGGLWLFVVAYWALNRKHIIKTISVDEIGRIF